MPEPRAPVRAARLIAARRKSLPFREGSGDATRARGHPRDLSWVVTFVDVERVSLYLEFGEVGVVYIERGASYPLVTP
jgi:hypothetical protein